MKLRLTVAASSLLAVASAMATTVPISLTAPDGSGMKVDYDATTNVYTLTVVDPTQNPVVSTNKLAEVFTSDVKYLKFDYTTTDEFSNLPATAYNCGTNLNEAKARTISGTFTPGDTWRFYSLNITTWRGRLCKFGQAAGQYLDLNFAALPAGAVVKLRNPRWSSDEEPYKTTDISAGSEVTVEAEDFNQSLTITTHNSRQLDYPERPAYKNPTGDQFPIFAWGGPDYPGGYGFQDVDGKSLDLGAVELQRRYKEMAECGFNCTLGTAWPSVDRAALYSGGINGNIDVDLFEGIDMWLIAKAGMDNEPQLAADFKNSPRLAGYFIQDEPHFKDFPGMRSKVERIRQYDSDHLLYGNLLNISTDMAAIGATSYENYVQEFVRQVGLNFLSFDYYPVRQKDDTKEIILKPDFFKNLEIAAKMSKYYNMPFWSFGHSVASNCGTPNESYPTPTEDHLRVQVFMGLAYGSQGIQYFTYWCPAANQGYTYYDAPIVNNEKTPVWYAVQAINKDIKAMNDVFLGAEMLYVGYTHAETPMGCMRLTADMLPKGVTSVSATGQGVAVSLLHNGTKQYMMIVNPDIHNSQEVTVGLSGKLTQIKTDGTAAEVSGEQKTTLTPGGHLVYLVAENAPEFEKFKIAESPFERTDYRADATDVIISRDQSASGEHFLPDMGDRTWDKFSIIMPDNTNHVITEDDAIANWGSFYSYTVNATEDVDINIFVGHSVPWSEYGRVASTGATPGFGYMVENNPTLNWPKAYAAAMKLEVDGVEIAPSNQTMRPAVPETFDPAGTEFNRILADKSLWISTNPNDNVLYFWPKQGGKDDVEFQYNELPDYQSIHLAKGEHKIIVKSLSYPWHFDALKIDTKQYAGIEAIGVDNDANAPVEWYNIQGMRINPDTAAPGIYIRRQGSKATKVVL